jgi:hypothetical protein
MAVNPDALWEIVEAVATCSDVIATEGPNEDKYCVFCCGDEDYSGETEYFHRPDCIVLKARALMAQGKGGV